MSVPDFSKIRAIGGHVFVKLLVHADPHSLEAYMEGWYHKDGPGLQRIGFARAEVISASKGYYDDKLDQYGNIEKRGKFIPADPLIKPGAIVIFRGYLGDALKPHPLYGQDYSFIHLKHIDMVEEDINVEVVDVPNRLMGDHRPGD